MKSNAMNRFITHIFWRTLRRGLDAIARDKRGGVAVFLATAIVPLVGFLGLAVDTTRGYLVKSRLSQALDAAGLAGGRVIFSASRDADIQMYFSANFPANYMGATITGPFLVPAGTNNEKLTLTASAVIGTTFLRVLGIETMTVNSEVEVTREQQLLDVVLAIDVSGSMGSSAGGGQTRIQAARSAANTLVGILFGDAASSTLLNIGLVPWNSKVNVTRNGTTFNSALTTFQTVPTFKNPLTGVSQTRLYYANNSPVPLLSAPPSGWRGCVYDRYKNDANTFPKPLDSNAFSVINGIIYISSDYQYSIPNGATLCIKGSKQLTTTDDLAADRVEYVLKLARYNTLSMLGGKKANKFLQNDTSMPEIMAIRQTLEKEIANMRRRFTQSVEVI